MNRHLRREDGLAVLLNYRFEHKRFTDRHSNGKRQYCQAAKNRKQDNLIQLLHLTGKEERNPKRTQKQENRRG